jgi:NTE family protein
VPCAKGSHRSPRPVVPGCFPGMPQRGRAGPAPRAIFRPIVPPSSTALVLSGGGARAAYQVGALSALAEIAPGLETPIITGVSAGAINAVALAAHRGPMGAAAAALRRDWDRLQARHVFAVRPASLVGGLGRLVVRTLTGGGSTGVSFRGLLDPEPLRRYLGRHSFLAGIDRNLRRGRLRAVALSATSYADGAAVTFVQGGDDVPTWTRARRYAERVTLTVDHVLASSAIPILFPAVRVGQRYFGDGGVRQTAPLAPAIHLGASRIITVSVRGALSSGAPDAAYPSSAQLFGLLFHSVFLDALETDAERLDRVNRLLRHLTPAEQAAAGVRSVGLLMLRPSRDVGALARGYPTHFSPLLSTVLRAMGARQSRAADFMSYLLFDSRYLADLMDLGYHDTMGRRAGVERFLAAEI